MYRTLNWPCQRKLMGPSAKTAGGVAELVYRLIFGGVVLGISAAARREVIVIGDVLGRLVVVLLGRYLYHALGVGDKGQLDLRSVGGHEKQVVFSRAVAVYIAPVHERERTARAGNVNRVGAGVREQHCQNEEKVVA